MEALRLQLDVPRDAALLLHHAEATHGRHQSLLLLAEVKDLRTDTMCVFSVSSDNICLI